MSRPGRHEAESGVCQEIRIGRSELRHKISEQRGRRGLSEPIIRGGVQSINSGSCERQMYHVEIYDQSRGRTKGNRQVHGPRSLQLYNKIEESYSSCR